MKTQPGLHGVSYELSHEEYKILEAKLITTVVLVERQIRPDLVRAGLGDIAEILGIKLEKEEK